MDKKKVWNKKFEFRFDKLGKILVDAGHLTQDQLDDALEYQAMTRKDSNESLLIGEVITRLYGIPSITIESIFIRKQIKNTLYKVFKSSLKKDKLLTMRLDQAGSSFNEQVKSIDSKIDEWLINKSFYFDRDGNEISRKNHIERVDAKVLFFLNLKDDQTMSCKIDFSYHMQKGIIETDMADAIGLVRVDLIKKIVGADIKAQDPVKVDFSDVENLFGDL